MDRFYMNGYLWRIIFVNGDSPELIDRTGKCCLATTDPNRFNIYVSNQLDGDLKTKVIIHELGHATMFSYDLLDYIHQLVNPEHWIDVEEWICNFIADYGQKIFEIAKDLSILPAEIEKLVA